MIVHDPSPEAVQGGKVIFRYATPPLTSILPTNIIKYSLIALGGFWYPNRVCYCRTILPPFLNSLMVLMHKLGKNFYKSNTSFQIHFYKCLKCKDIIWFGEKSNPNDHQKKHYELHLVVNFQGWINQEYLFLFPLVFQTLKFSNES